MKKRYRSLGLRFKVVLAMTFIIILYSVIFSFVSIRNAQKEINRQLEASHMEITNQFNNYIDNLQSYLLDMSSTPYLNRTLLNILADRPVNTGTTTDAYLHDFLFTTIMSKNNFSFAGVINQSNLSNGYYITTDTSFGLTPYADLVKTDSFLDFIQNDYDFACYPMPAGDTSILSNNVQDKILYIRTIKDTQDRFNLLGYLLLGINTSTFDAQCKSVIDTNVSGLTMTDSKGRPLYQYGMKEPDFSESTEQSTEISYEKSQDIRYLKCITKENSLNWTITYYTDLSHQAAPSLSNTITYIILIAVAAITVFILIASLITSAVTSPMKKLLYSIQHFQTGDFDQQVEIKYNDEIGQLTEGYNQMVNRIRELIQQNYEIKIQEQKAQLAALQTQINPHFLYNTLDLLYWKAIAYDQDEIAELVYSLSRLFRISLNKGNSFISYEKETEFLSCYLTLQKSLMSERLSYTLTVPDSIKSTYLPRFLLQPLIENAIVHGLDDNMENPRLTVTITDHIETVSISILDNGKGMDESAINRLLSSDTASTEDPAAAEKGYAIPNILHRLQIYYGTRMSFKIESRINSGTCILLELPVTKTLQEETDHV
ncbi:sensor histidine kinase [uncultured Robinsoniella sp.]|uniref:cache domain-containing sensor histidine kinase n=1 Tax=uncultured Robinsoniella sp. TaxID=904190 RepID=UPI00374E9751